MELVLWRHAEAEDDAPSDLQRNLTPKGQRQAQKMAAWFASQIDGAWDGWSIVVSPANRAQQTASALGRPFATAPSIAPDASVDALLSAAGWRGGAAGDTKAKVLLVGHQPTLGMLAAYLIDGSEGYLSVKKGAMWWFETRLRDGETQTVLKAMVTPDTVSDSGLG
jgi:phosphohistidine phosphatase